MGYYGCMVRVTGVLYADGAQFRLNLAHAYPPEARLASWVRTIRLLRSSNTIELTEDYALKQSAKEITLILMTPCRVDASTPGRLLMMRGPGPVAIQYDSAIFRPSVEEVRIEDPRLHSTWGDLVYRILLHAASPPARAKWTPKIRKRSGSGAGADRTAPSP